MKRISRSKPGHAAKSPIGSKTKSKGVVTASGHGKDDVDKGYDDGVQKQGPGVESEVGVMQPAHEEKPFPESGSPLWDEAKGPPSPDNEPFALEFPTAETELAGTEELTRLTYAALDRRARALKIPGRTVMTKMQLANAINALERHV